MLLPLSYVVVLFCTGSMTGIDSLCPVTDPYLLIPLNVQYVLPGTELNPGSIYGYQTDDSRFQFIVHRLISYDKNFAVFKGDSNEYSEIVSSSRIIFKVNGKLEENIYA